MHWMQSEKEHAAPAMKITHKTASRILWYEGAGFLLLAVLSWMDEYHLSWHESLLESGAVLGVGAVVFYFTQRLVSHLYYLEGFLRVCASCQKIGYEGQWVPLEQYFSESFNTKTSHGLCPECVAKIRMKSHPDF
jgi:hypothetical protein